MLRILLYSEVDSSIRYAATEVLDHLGLPFGMLKDLKELNAQHDSHVVLIPETAIVDSESEERIFRSFPAVVYAGCTPSELHLETGESQLNPFKGFSVEELAKASFRVEGKINSQDGEINGIVLRHENFGTLVFLLPGLFKLVATLFSGPKSEEEETFPQIFEKFGAKDGNRNSVSELLSIPIINIYEELLLKVFRKVSEEKKIPMVRKWFHPNNHLMTVCLTHDVDVLSRVTRVDILKAFAGMKLKQGMVGIMLVALCELSKILSRPAQSRPGFLIDPLKKLAVRLMPHSPSWNLDEYNEVEARINAKSTYFLLVHPSEESCRRCCVRLDLLQEAAVRIAEKGHEIGLHGSCASSDNASQMMKEKNELESILSKRTDGVRQHLLKMCLPETWEYQQEAGFVYDASLGYNQLVGFRAGTCFPFTPWDSEGEKRFTILELPLVVQDKALFGDSNADCILKKAFDKCGKLLDVTYNHNGVFTVLWHACVSRVTKPYLVDFYRKMIKYASRYDPWYANCTSLTSWWKLRSKIRLEPEKVIKSELEFSAVSPEDFEGFSISLHLPKNPRAVQVFIRDKRLDDEKILRKEDELLISFDLVEGKNQVKILC